MTRDVASLAEVSARRENVLLSGDSNGSDLALRCTLLEPGKSLCVLLHRERTEGIWPGVVATVVESDQGKRLATGEGNILHIRVGDNLVGGQLQKILELVRHYFLTPLFLPRL